MSSKTPGEPEDKSHNTLPFLPHRHVHIPSAPGPSGMTTVNLSPAPPDLPIAPLGPVSLVMLRPSDEKDRVLPSGMTDTRLQSQSLQGAASNTAPADSPSTVTDSSRRPGAEHSDDDSEASPSHKQVSAKSKKKKRTRTLTTAPQAAALFALLARTQFPTTSEREEIGRGIGLSARKVQIWFQNQRQKQKKLANSLQSQSQPELAASAPLPLMSQPGFSASHAARFSDNQSLGVTGFGTPMHDNGAVMLRSPYAEGTSGRSDSIPVVNRYQYSPSSGFPSRAHTGQSQRPLGHPQLLDYSHSPSQYNMYPPTSVSDFSFPFSGEPPGTMDASSFAAQPWLFEDVQQGPDVTSLPHPPIGATSPHLRRLPPLGPTVSAPAGRSFYDPRLPVSQRLSYDQSSSAAQLMQPHDVSPTVRASGPPSQMASLHLRNPAHRAYRGSFSRTTGPPQQTFLSTQSGHIPSSILPESPNLGAYGSPHSNLVPTLSPHSRATTPYGSQAAGRSRGTEVHSVSPPMNRKRPHPHEGLVESKRSRQGTMSASSLSPPASFSETTIPYSRRHHAMHVPLPTHSPLFQGHIADPFSEAVPQPGVLDSQSWSVTTRSTNSNNDDQSRW